MRTLDSTRLSLAVKLDLASQSAVCTSADIKVVFSASRAAERGNPIADKKGTDHVDIKLEHNAFALGMASRPQPGSGMSWRNAPEGAMSLLALSGTLLICLGLLLGASWTTQALQSKLSKQAQERRKLDEEWEALRNFRRQQSLCPHCGALLAEWRRHG